MARNHKESKETPEMEAKEHSKGFLKKAMMKKSRGKKVGKKKY